MKWYRTSKISTKLMIGFFIAALIATAIGIFGIFSIFGLEQQNAALYKEFAQTSALVAAREAEVIADAQKSVIIIAASIVSGIVLCFLIGLYISHLITGPLDKMLRAAERLETGDLSVYTDYTEENNPHRLRKDEIGRLGSALHRLIVSTKGQVCMTQTLAAGDLSVDVKLRSEHDMLGKGITDLIQELNHVISSIATAAEQVAAGSNLVSVSSTALSQGATEQASAVEELTASLEEISSQTNLNSQNAEKANELARNAKINADNGNLQMREMLKAMDEINVSSSNINKIIKVIDDIAFQTNILALNAAVEAARAGQHGKGFAVVAEEVRTLAARSANAARETTDMIEGSIKKVEAGTKIANDTAKALLQIVDQVEKAASLVSSIAVASKEQAVGIEQINQGIMQVSQVVQTNAATSEESAAASEELTGQAQRLKTVISFFKLKNSAAKLESADAQMPPHEGTSESKKTEALVGAGTAKVKIALSDSEFGKY